MSDSSVFDQFAPQQPESDDDKETYNAYGVSSAKKRNGETRLRICFADGTVAMPSYAYLVDVIYTSHQFVSLIFTRFVIELRGRNLTALLDLIQDEQLRYVQCYRADFFAEPPPEEPVILSITRQMLGGGEDSPAS